LQRPTFAGLEEHVFRTFVHLYRKIQEGRNLVKPDHFYELRYEELVRDPVGQMRSLYEHLGLGDFEVVRPSLEKYLASIAGYETNRYQLTPEMHEEITRRWGEVIQKYGYGQHTNADQTPFSREPSASAQPERSPRARG
jgi:hypothetical protein